MGVFFSLLSPHTNTSIYIDVCTLFFPINLSLFFCSLLTRTSTSQRQCGSLWKVASFRHTPYEVRKSKYEEVSPSISPEQELFVFFFAPPSPHLLPSLAVSALRNSHKDRTAQRERQGYACWWIGQRWGCPGSRRLVYGDRTRWLAQASLCPRGMRDRKLHWRKKGLKTMCYIHRTNLHIRIYVQVLGGVVRLIPGIEGDEAACEVESAGEWEGAEDGGNESGALCALCEVVSPARSGVCMYVCIYVCVCVLPSLSSLNHGFLCFHKIMVQ